MPFKKGQSGNPAGKPRGIKNKASESLRFNLNRLLEEQFALVAKDFQKLEPRDRVNAWLKLLEFALPKQRQNAIIDVSQLSETEVDELLNRALSITDNSPNPQDDEE